MRRGGGYSKKEARIQQECSRKPTISFGKGSPFFKRGFEQNDFFKESETLYIGANTFLHMELPVVLCGCETWSLTLREERKLRVFENMVLRTIFGPRRDEVTGEWRRLHNEEINDLYCSPNIARVIKW